MGVRKTEKGASLRRWFKEEWTDVRTGKACGRSEGEDRGTPYCRPKKRISGKIGEGGKKKSKFHFFFSKMAQNRGGRVRNPKNQETVA